MIVNGGSFFGRWVTAVFVTMFVAVIAAFASMWSLAEVVEQAWGELPAMMIAGAIFGGLIGLGFGLGSGLVLRAQAIPLGQWVGRTVLAGAIGVAIGITLFFSFLDPENSPDVVVGMAMALSLGLPIGLVQAQLLRGRLAHLAQAQLWIPVCLVAFFVGLTVGLPLGGEGREWLSLGVVALLTAIFSGAGMVWLGRGRETAVAA